MLARRELKWTESRYFLSNFYTKPLRFISCDDITVFNFGIYLFTTGTPGINVDGSRGQWC